MAHENRWFTELQNGWIFPWQTVNVITGISPALSAWQPIFGAAKGDPSSMHALGCMRIAEEAATNPWHIMGFP